MVGKAYAKPSGLPIKFHVSWLGMVGPSMFAVLSGFPGERR